jgi:hypothetical protein
VLVNRRRPAWVTSRLGGLPSARALADRDKPAVPLADGFFLLSLPTDPLSEKRRDLRLDERAAM